MNEILKVREKVYSDESISKKEFHTYSSYNQTFKPNDSNYYSKSRLVRAFSRKLP